MSVVELGPVVKTLDVRRAAADAFRLFTDEISAWWPMAATRAKDAAGEKTVRIAIEPRVGGRVFETLNTGEERDWGEVLAFEPGQRVAFTFQFGRAKEKSGEVEVRFEPLDAKSCRVTLTHAHWERLGAEAEQMRGRYAGGWEFVFVDGFGAYAGTL
jgi:uncharacterized protein YndB with AHSA1/START domain